MREKLSKLPTNSPLIKKPFGGLTANMLILYLIKYFA